MKKLTYEFVKDQIEKVKGYKLLSKEYIGALKKLLVRCDKGHEYEVKYNGFQRGKRCPECANDKQGGYSKKHTYEFVKEQIESVEGYKLLSKEYVNNKTKLRVCCDKGHEYEVRYSNFQRGQRCPECVNDKQGGYSKKHTYEFVKEQIESVEGYKLLSKEYVNNKTKLRVCCDKGHEYEVIYNNFKKGNRCQQCSGNRNIKLTYEFVKEQIEKEKGYKLLSKEYVNNRTKLKVCCDKGHEYSTAYSNFKRGKRCPYCAGVKKLTYEFVKEQIEKEKGYKLLSKEYINARKKLEMQCPEGHKYSVTYSNFKKGARCPICNAEKTSSKGEKEVLQMIKRFTGEEVFENDRTQIINPLTGWNLELDIWIPSLNKAIEYNGTYWHSGNEQKQKDQEKVKQCKEKGIDLLTIKEEHWQSAQILCEKIIEEFIKS